jgi:hypothetical protein
MYDDIFGAGLDLYGDYTAPVLDASQFSLYGDAAAPAFDLSQYNLGTPSADLGASWLQDYQAYDLPSFAGAGADFTLQTPTWDALGQAGGAPVAPAPDPEMLREIARGQSMQARGGFDLATGGGAGDVGGWAGRLGALPGKVGESAIGYAERNPLNALMALGGGGLAAYGMLSPAGRGQVKAPERTAQLTPEEQALFSRATAKLPQDPLRQKRYAEMRAAVLDRVRRELGPGGEYSTPGQAAITAVEEQIAKDLMAAELADINIAQSGFQNLSSLVTGQQNLQARINAANAAAAQQRAAGQAQLGMGMLGWGMSPAIYGPERATARG